VWNSSIFGINPNKSKFYSERNWEQIKRQGVLAFIRYRIFVFQFAI